MWRKTIYFNMLIIFLLLMTGCSEIKNNGNKISSELQYWKYREDIPVKSNYQAAPKFGYWWEDELEKNPDWWRQDYQIDNSYWEDDDYYKPINEYVPNTNFEEGDSYIEDEYNYYRFHQFLFSVMPYKEKETDQTLHCVNFLYSYTWYYGLHSGLSATPIGSSLILPEEIQENLESGYYIKDPTPQFMLVPNGFLSNNNKILTSYLAGISGIVGGYGYYTSAVRSDSLNYPLFLQFRPNILKYIVEKNIEFAGSDLESVVSTSDKQVHIYYTSFGFCKTSPLTEDDINTISESEFKIVFPDGRDMSKCSLKEEITDEYICPPYIEAKIGKPLKVIPPAIKPFKFTSPEDSKIPLNTLVDEPFITYMR